MIAYSVSATVHIAAQAKCYESPANSFWTKHFAPCTFDAVPFQLHTPDLKRIAFRT